MENNEEIVVKNAFDAFLRIACEKAKGDVRKNIKNISAPKKVTPKDNSSRGIL